jgi:Periplasmic component of the Tol biopolymer transport system
MHEGVWRNELPTVGIYMMSSAIPAALGAFRMSRAVARPLLLVLTLVLATLPVAAQQSVEADKALLATERYVRPPEEVAKLVTAPRQLNSTLSQQSPDKTHFLVVHGEGLGVEAKFAKPHYYFGGLQVDYKANRVRSFTTRGQTAIEIVDALSGSRVSMKAPSGATMSSPSWSPSGGQIAYFANFDDASYVYVADARTGKLASAQ